MEHPLILVSNDDGISSEGLWAVVEAVVPLGDVLVVAPDKQWSGAGRCMPHTVTGAYRELHRRVLGYDVMAYAVDASPALAVEHGILEFAPREPDLVISGINFGANVSVDVTISGTVGAALEAGSFGIPSLAVSLEMNSAFYLTGDSSADYSAAQAYCYRLAETLLRNGMPHGVDVLNVNIPSDATPHTPWRHTRLSRFRYFSPLRPDRAQAHARPRYEIIRDPSITEPNSDLYVLLVDRQITITPLTLDLTLPTSGYLFDQSTSDEIVTYQAIPTPAFSVLRENVDRDLVAITVAQQECLTSSI